MVCQSTLPEVMTLPPTKHPAVKHADVVTLIYSTCE